MTLTQTLSGMEGWHGMPSLRPGCIHEYVEIAGTASGVVVERHTKTDEDIPLLCENSSTAIGHEWTLRLLITQQTKDIDYCNLPYSMEMLGAFEKHWNIPIASFTYVYVTSSSSLVTNDQSAPQIIRLSMRSNAHLCMAYNSVPNITFAVLYTSSKRTVDTTIEALVAMKEHAFQPTLLPFILAERLLDESETSFRQLWQDFNSVHRDLGCNRYSKHRSNPQNNVDVTDMPLILTCLADAAADTTMKNVATAQRVNFLDVLMEKYHGLGPKELIADMRMQIDLMHHRCEKIKLRNEYMKSSIQAMVQMVYALLQQKDNELNRRYTADMRVITAITLVFLPGTFVATLFSASFWNFDPRSTGPLVSAWVWLYFFVTLALTLFVLCIWRGYTVLKQSVRTVRRVWGKGTVLRWLGSGKKLGDEEIGKKGD